MNDITGSTIGNYSIIRKIGEGGFGKTYEALHKEIKKKACLKLIIPPKIGDEVGLEDRIEILRQEASLLWEIHHYSLPTMRDFFQYKDSYVLAMSFIEGKTLTACVEKHKAIHPEDVSWITQRLLNSLYYLHSHGVIHGDIKPANVIVQPKDHNAFLVDFGLSSLKPMKDSSAIGYTPLFVAPEVENGKPPIPESDLYCLGLTMIYSLGGDPALKSFPDHVPAELRQFYTELVHYNPSERPSWAKQDLVARLSDARLKSFGRRSMTGWKKE